MAGSTFLNRLGKISSLLIVVFPLLALSGCFGEGDGPTVIPATPVTPEEPPTDGGEAFDSGLLINGDFEAGVSPWIGNAANVVDDGGNAVNSADIAVAGDAFNVNLSQVLTITEGETYTLSFKARSNRTRTMLAGIGLNEEPFTNTTETVNLTAQWQTFVFNFTATGFGNANSRVLFDMGADTGLVLIDDVSLFAASGGGAGGTPIDPDATLYATGSDPDLVIPDDYAERTPFGSGSIIDPFYAEDETYSPVLSVFSGTNYGANIAQVGFIGFPAGFLGAYETVDFKVKGMPNFVVFVKLFDGVDTLRINLTSSNFSELLVDGWYQVSIPVSRFSDVDQGTGIVFESDNSAAMQFSMLLTDIGFSGVGTGGPDPDPEPGDHGPDTAGIFTETTTETTITVTGITNSADFGGNNTVADPESTAIPAFDGSVVLSIDYQDSGSTFGGALLNFGGANLTAYDTLNFTIDTSAFTGLADLTIQLEPPGAGAAGTNVALSAYTPVATNGNWVSYAIPLADFTATDFSSVANLGFWNARDGGGALVFGTLYVDDVYVSTEGGGGGGPGGGDHGAGSAGVFTETATESPITVTSITNSADFGGNNTVADPESTAIPAFDGSVVLSIDYQDSGSTFGGAVLNFGGVDLTAYDTLNFTIDTSTFTGLADLTIQIEPPGAGAPGTNVALSAYTPVATSGNWVSYAIPLADFTATDFSAAANLGFWNARDGGGALVFGTLYIDDVYFSTEGGGAVGDHGPGTAGVYTETTTESTVPVTSITNSADFGGNSTVADPNSTAIPAFDGSVVLSIDYQDSGSTFGGAVLNFGGVDLTAYDTLNFTIDTSTFTGLADLTIQIEPPGAGAPGTNVALSAYTPVATSGDWVSYAIPLADFTATDFSAAANLGFWNARDGGGALVFGTLYIDDVYFSTEGGGAVGDHGPGTAGVYTETTTESTVPVTSITNSADFGGNSTVADPNSTAIPAFDGSVVLSIDYQDSGSTFGGAVLNFGGVDLTAYDTLNFTIDTSTFTGLADLTIQIEPPGAGAPGTNVALSAYTPVATNGNWVSYAIPLADFTATDFSAAANLGFWNARDGGGALVFGTLYIDDVYFSTEGGGAVGDHGPGTAGVYTETTTESTVPVTSITNSADFGGNSTVADPNSTAIPAFDGSVVLSIDYQDSGSTFGGAVLNFGGVDLTAYDTLNFTIDTSTFTGLADLTIQIEPPGAGAPGTNVALSAYTPVATSGDWVSYAIPLADFTATDFSAAANLGFWNARDGGGALVFGTLYIDDVYFSSATGGEIAVNGGFETGDFSNWSLFPVSADPNEQTVVTTNPKTGTYAGRINNTTPGSASIMKQANLMPVSIGQTATISFSARGSLTAGGVAFAEFFTEISGGGTSSATILGGGPLALNADPDVWTDFEFVISISTDVSGGVTLQLTGTTGGDSGSVADVYYDDISIVITD